MHAIALALVLGQALAGHSASAGKSSFVVGADRGPDGRDGARVDITIHLLETDLPELCDVDFGVKDPQKRALLEEKLQLCVADGFPGWLRLHRDRSSCPVGAGRVSHGAGLEVVLEAFAICPPLEAGWGSHTLTIDWGLFATTPLDHQSTATVTFEHGRKQLALLSKRKNKLVIELPDHKPVTAAVVVAGVAVVAVVVGLLLSLRLRRRRRRGA